MKTNELRIGNYVASATGPQEVSEILSENKIKIKNNNSHFDFGECVLPIPLTEEWLLKFGFSDGYTEFKKRWFVICSEDESFYFQFENYSVEFPDVKIKYVHQLQNLYFALVGEELELKPSASSDTTLSQRSIH